MRINKLYIGDFGCYGNQTFDDLRENIIMVGGRNRAGKSTLMTVLRCLAYGTSKGGRIPEANVNYRVEADMSDAGKSYVVTLNGHAEPKAIEMGSKNMFIAKELYKVDRQAYEQLFTISLDELARCTQGDKNYQALLIGGGFKEYVEIPNMLGRFNKLADNIGGKHGRVSTKQFKPYGMLIDEGIALEKKVVENVREYSIRKQELENLQEEMQQCQMKISQCRSKIEAMELMKNAWDSFENHELIERNLKDREDLNSRLGEQEQNIRNLRAKLSGIEELNKRCLDLKAQYEREHGEIILDMDGVNENWKGEFNFILGLPCDEISISELNGFITQHDDLKKKKSICENDLENLHMRIQSIENEKQTRPKRSLNFTLWMFEGFSFVFSIVIFLNAGIAITMIYLAFVLVTSYLLLAGDRRALDGKDELKRLHMELRLKEEQFDQIAESMDEMNEGVAREYKNPLKLTGHVEMEDIREYLRYAKDLKRRINQLKFIDAKAMKCEKELLAYAMEIRNVVSTIEGSEVAVPVDADCCEKAVRELARCHEMLCEYKDEKKKMKEIENYLSTVFSSENVKKTIHAQCSNEDMLHCIRQAFYHYNSKETLQEHLEGEKRDLENEKLKLDNLNDSLHSIKEQMRRIMNEEDEFAATEKIHKGTRELRPLAEKYAVLRAAEFILNEIQRDFVENERDQLFKKASSCFSIITSGEYEKILPPDKMDCEDFNAITREGGTANGTETLSRGTREQLFLSMRFSRIREIEPHLPVIIDDSLVNFDMQHLKNTAVLLGELSKTNQTFILTCHPHVIDAIEEAKVKCQYFCVQGGKVSSCSPEELKNHLM